MEEIDPKTLMEWLSIDAERDMQLIALENLCMSLLISDNVDSCFEMYPPRLFVPAICQLFLDGSAPDNVLEVTARAITCYLDISADCTKQIIAIDGVLNGFFNRLVVTDKNSRTNVDLAEQCCKVLELICIRYAGDVFEAGGLRSVLLFISDVGSYVHKDTLRSAMNVVSKLCSKIEPNKTSLSSCVKCLCTMLKHEDADISSEALECFVTLANRFTHDRIDHALLAQHGLLNELLLRLSSAAEPAVINIGTTGLNASSSTTEVKSSRSISTVISLLTTLCRGSKSVSHDLFRSNLADVIEKALKGDEKCCYDTMRLVSLLLTLLFEGHDAVLWGTIVCADDSIPNLSRVVKFESRVIDFIRNKDTASFIETVNSNAIDVNSMDDVGQTLLNWASAFGTKKMVEFLCSKGANVHKGQRSSSLHYAAYFGKSSIVKILLKNGANPELRDEEGKTPADKAREKMKEEHHEVLAILEAPEWKLSSKNKTVGSNEPKGDPEMVPIYLKRLMPIFCLTFQSSMLPLIKTTSLSLIKKMAHYIEPDLLEDICKSNYPKNFASLLVEVLATVLDNEKNNDDHLIALQTMSDLLIKCQDIFLDHFSSLGVFCKVQQLIETDDSSEKYNDIKVDLKQYDVKKILPKHAYHWKDWFFCRVEDCLYAWNEYVILELSNGSNGWFRFIVNNKLSTMYSIGNPEELDTNNTRVPDHQASDEFELMFIEKYLLSISCVTPNTISNPLLSLLGASKIEIGNWFIISLNDNELKIQNTKDMQQIIRLNCETIGFSFQSNQDKKYVFTDLIPLKSDMYSGWKTVKKTNLFTTKSETIGQKIQKQAKDIYDKFFKAAQTQPRSVVISLSKIITGIKSAIKNQSNAIENSSNNQTWASTLCKVISDLQQLLMEDEGNVSAYEIHSSGLVEVLLQLLTSNCQEQDNDFAKLQKCRVDIFVKCFKKKKNDRSTDTYASVLVKKLISVLELLERLPVYLYESSGDSYGLKILSRHIKFRLEKPVKETTLVDRTGRGLKTEPLCTVYQLEKFLLKLVTKQWYESERATYSFIKKFKEGIKPMTYKHYYDFDKNGVLYWIGTNGKTSVDWVNPGECGLMRVQCSDGPCFPYGQKECILNRKVPTINCHTKDSCKSWFTIDLGLWLIPTEYTLRHCKGFGLFALRNWLFQMSKDGINWITLYTHIDDSALDESGGTATWYIDVNDEKEYQGWRYVKIQQNGENSGGSHYISLSGFEIYGSVTNVCEDLGITTEKSKSSCECENHICEDHMNKQKVDSVPLDANGQLRNQPAIGNMHCVTDGVNNTMIIHSPDYSFSNITTGIPNSNYSLSNTSNGNLRTVSVANTDEATSAEIVPSNQRLSNRVMSYVINDAHLHPPDSHKSSCDFADFILPTFNMNTRPSFISTPNDIVVSETSTPIDRNISFGRFVNADTLPSVAKCEANSIDKPIIINSNTIYSSNSQKQNVCADTLINDAITSTFNLSNLELETESRKKRNQISSNQKTVSTPDLTSNAHLISQEDIIPMQEPVAGTSASYQTHINMDGTNNSLNNQKVINHKLSQVSTSESNLVTLKIPTNFSNQLHQIPKIYPSLLDIDSSSITTIANKPFCAGDVSIMRRASTSTYVDRSSVEEFFNSINNRTFFTGLRNEIEIISDVLYDIDDNYQESREEINERTCETRIITGGSSMYRTDRISGTQKKVLWDDNYVLKAKFISLIPAFDPRPGRTNVHQISNLEIASPLENENDECPDNLNIVNKEISLKLTLRGPNIPEVKNVEIELNSKWTIFHAIQKLAQLIDFGNNEKKSKELWEPTYTIIYEVLTDVDAQGLGVDPDNQWDSDLPIFPTRTQLTNTNHTVDRVLQLLQELHNFSINPLISLLKPYSDDFFEIHKYNNGEITNDDIFNSKKITSKLVQQIQDPMVLSSNALPSWCEHMIRSYSFLFSFKTRHLYFSCTAFGPPRSIVWLQSQRENVDRNRNRIGSTLTLGREDPYSVSRLKHDRVSIPRGGDNILALSRQIMLKHVERQTVLEFEFIGEEGTGLGPTLEFYSLIAAEFQRKDLCMWMCNDEISDDMEETSQCSWIRENAKPLGYYVWQANGLFPAPLPQNSPCCDEAVKNFWLLGAFLAKVLQDNRLIDLPLSLPFFKLLTKVKNNELSKVLDESDLFSMDYQLSMFIKDLKMLILSKEKILLDQSLNDDEKYQQIKNLRFQCGAMENVHLEDLSLNMIYLPLSHCFPFHYINLVDEGLGQEVNINNVEQYVDLLTDFILNTGIKRQIEALKAGFCCVFPIEKLMVFTPLELKQILNGQQEPSWTREDLLNYTVPKLGYDKESPGFLRFVNVLVEMNPMERKSFLQFATGCSSLPPGGLANMHPRLTVVRKVDGGGPGSYPSVNTCVHYLKLPEYPDEQTLRDRLLAATLEEGFHLN